MWIIKLSIVSLQDSDINIFLSLNLNNTFSNKRTNGLRENKRIIRVVNSSYTTPDYDTFRPSERKLKEFFSYRKKSFL